MELKTLEKVKIRPIADSDNIEELTLLLNTAYKKLADQGFRYLASHQDSKITKERLKKGKCFVAILEDKLAGTITYYSPGCACGNEWYDHEHVASYGQFAVDPQLQGSGLGSKLIELVEKLAAEDNAGEIAVDTAEGATELIKFYSKRGYRLVGHTQWKETNYRSVLLSKELKKV